MLRYHTYGTAGLSDGDDRRRMQIYRCGTGRMGNSVRNIGPIFNAPALEPGVIIDIRLGTQGNLYHGLQSLHRILAGRCV